MINVFFVCLSLLGEGDTLKSQCKYYYDSLVNMNVYTHVDTKPIYSGKESDINSVFLKNIILKKPESFSYVIYLDFIIDTCGNIISPRIHGKSESEYNKIEKDVIDITQYLKCWLPARCGNKKVPYLKRLRIIS